jgi:sulfite exporter TauE/SafE
MIALLGSVLLASLVGSAHCAGMCGGFVAFYAGQSDARSRLWAHVAYNAGRLVSYAALGFLAGALGAGLDRVGALAGVSRLAAVLTGALMVTWGVAVVLRQLGVRVPAARAPKPLESRLAQALRALRGQPAELRALGIGLLSTLLPCGWLYAFAATAAGTGAGWSGALVLLAFWAGTLPVMAGLGAAAHGLLRPLARRIPILTASALVALGLLTMAGRLQPHHLHGGRSQPAPPAARAPASPQAPSHRGHAPGAGGPADTGHAGH